MLLTPKRSDKKEILDTEDYTEKDLEENLKDIRFWNKIFGVHNLMLRYIKKIIGKYNLSKIKILDVGTGSGDIPRCIVKYLRNKNIPVKILAIDSNPITVKIPQQLYGYQPPTTQPYLPYNNPSNFLQQQYGLPGQIPPLDLLFDQGNPGYGIEPGY